MRVFKAAVAAVVYIPLLTLVLVGLVVALVEAALDTTYRQLLDVFKWALEEYE